MNTPAIHEVRKRFPDARITIVADNKMADYIRTGIGKDWDNVVCWNSKVNTVLKLLRDLKVYGTPDLILIMHSHNPYDYMSAVMTGAPFVFRYNHPDNPVSLIEPWLTNYNDCSNRHAIQLRLDLIAPLQCQLTKHSIEMHVPCEVTKVPSQWHNVGFQMGASSKERCWPVSNFVQLATTLISADDKIRVVLFGSPAEKYLAEQFMALLPVEFHNHIETLIGKTSMTELTQAINNVDVVVTGDTGTMHIAVALKVRTVSLFVSAAPFGTGPYQDPSLHRVVTGFTSPLLTPSGSQEMSAISPDRVIIAVQEALADVYPDIYELSEKG